MASTIKTRDGAVRTVGSRPEMFVPEKQVPKETCLSGVFYSFAWVSGEVRPLSVNFHFSEKLLHLTGHQLSRDALCPREGSLAGTNSRVESNFGDEKKSFLLMTYSPQRREVTAGTQAGQELKQRPWRDTAYWLAFHDSLSLPLYNPGLPAQVDPTHSGLDPPTLIINQEIDPQIYL